MAAFTLFFFTSALNLIEGVSFISVSDILISKLSKNCLEHLNTSHPFLDFPFGPSKMCKEAGFLFGLKYNDRKPVSFF